jgi:hypothetical protein
MYTFQVVTREVQHAGRQITADVVRNDGRVVRSGMWPDYAEADCALLNEYCAGGWTAAQYHAERATRMAAVRV